jgi:predicted site-specific integrase-resolvase
MDIGCSTRQAARKLKVALITLQRHVTSGRLPSPPIQTVGGVRVRLWSERDIERAKRELKTVKPGPKPKSKKRGAPK